MFVEKLNKKDLEKFAALHSCSLYEYKLHEGGTLYVELSNGAMGPQPEFWFTDFECRASDYYRYAEDTVKKNWRKFMFETFGEEYKKTLLDHGTQTIKRMIAEATDLD